MRRGGRLGFERFLADDRRGPPVWRVLNFRVLDKQLSAHVLDELQAAAEL